MTTLVPPIKCQGIKTKLVPEILRLTEGRSWERWIEPFCGSCVVALNVQPASALLCDVNTHIIGFYRAIQRGSVSKASVREWLQENGEHLQCRGQEFYYEVRARFNQYHDPHDFLFLNRACFNGVMRFNRKGQFNVPFCHKDGRFSKAYITKIVNQVHAFHKVSTSCDWQFEVADFRDTLGTARADDFVYADPPYIGRHVDYFSSWGEEDEESLTLLLQALPCDFILSTWHGNRFRSNHRIDKHWSGEGFHVFTRTHHYHVGASEANRHSIEEALVTNYLLNKVKTYHQEPTQLYLFEEQARYVCTPTPR